MVGPDVTLGTCSKHENITRSNFSCKKWKKKFSLYLSRIHKWIRGKMAKFIKTVQSVDDWPYLITKSIFIGVFCIIIGLFALMFFSIKEQATLENEWRKNVWEPFKAEHNCKEIIIKEGRAGINPAPIFTSNGLSMGFVANSTPPEKGWLCDDGMIYTGNN